MGYVALPDERKVHTKVTPYGGGAAMLVGLCVALVVASAIPSLRMVITSSHEMIGVLLAAGSSLSWACSTTFVT
jgi:UDP-N-acetylmuramyl pentapeptide phosphotransferase/UDP-N-acetylglucosamine-1-phosphate transferase